MALKQPDLKLVVWSDNRDKSGTIRVTISELPLLEIRKEWRRRNHQIHGTHAFLSGQGLAALNSLGALAGVLKDIEKIALIAYFEGMRYTLKNVKAAHVLCQKQGKRL